MNSLSFCSKTSLCHLPSEEYFTAYRILGWQSFSLSTLKGSFYCLLGSSLTSLEKPAIALDVLPSRIFFLLLILGFSLYP